MGCVMRSMGPKRHVWECSACGEEHERDYMFSFCPWCGERIDGFERWAEPLPEEDTGRGDWEYERMREEHFYGQ